MLLLFSQKKEVRRTPYFLFYWETLFLSILYFIFVYYYCTINF